MPEYQKDVVDESNEERAMEAKEKEISILKQSYDNLKAEYDKVIEEKKILKGAFDKENIENKALKRENESLKQAGASDLPESIKKELKIKKAAEENKRYRENYFATRKTQVDEPVRSHEVSSAEEGKKKIKVEP